MSIASSPLSYFMLSAARPAFIFSRAAGIAVVSLCCSSAMADVPDGSPTYSSCVMCSDQIYLVKGRWMYYDFTRATSNGTPLIPVRESIKRVGRGVLRVGDSNEFAYYCDFDNVMRFNRQVEVPVCTSRGWGLVPRAN